MKKALILIAIALLVSCKAYDCDYCTEQEKEFIKDSKNEGRW